MVYPDYKSVALDEVREFYEKFWGTELTPKRGLTVVEIVDATLAGEIKGIYVMGANPALSAPAHSPSRPSLAALEGLVGQGTFRPATAWHPHASLPSRTEKTS